MAVAPTAISPAHSSPTKRRPNRSERPPPDDLAGDVRVALQGEQRRREAGVDPLADRRGGTTSGRCPRRCSRSPPRRPAGSGSGEFAGSGAGRRRGCDCPAAPAPARRAIAPGAAVSCRPLAAAPLAGTAPFAAAGPFDGAPGTITAGPLVISQTNGRATSESTAKPTAAARQPSSGIRPGGERQGQRHADARARVGHSQRQARHPGIPPRDRPWSCRRRRAATPMRQQHARTRPSGTPCPMAAEATSPTDRQQDRAPTSSKVRSANTS